MLDRSLYLPPIRWTEGIGSVASVGLGGIVAVVSSVGEVTAKFVGPGVGQGAVAVGRLVVGRGVGSSMLGLAVGECHRPGVLQIFHYMLHSQIRTPLNSNND